MAIVPSFIQKSGGTGNNEGIFGLYWANSDTTEKLLSSSGSKSNPVNFGGNGIMGQLLATQGSSLVGSHVLFHIHLDTISSSRVPFSVWNFPQGPQVYRTSVSNSRYPFHSQDPDLSRAGGSLVQFMLATHSGQTWGTSQLPSPVNICYLDLMSPPHYLLKHVTL